MDFYISSVAAQLDVNDPRQKEDVVAKVIPLLRLMPDGITRRHYVQDLALRLRIDSNAIDRELRRSPAARSTASIAAPSAAIRKEQDNEDHLLALLLKYEVVTEEVRAAARPDDFLDARNRAIFDALRRQYADDALSGQTEALDPMLEEHTQALVALLSDRSSVLPIKVRTEASQTLEKLRKDRYDRLIRELQMDIALAQREGDEELVDSLLMQYGQLTSEHKQYAPRKSPYFRDTRDPRPAASKFKPTT
jgi:DNA primase